MVYSVVKSPMGDMSVIAEGDAIVGVDFGVRDDLCEDSENAAIKAGKKWLSAYFAGDNPDIAELTIKPQGTEFAKNVWDELIKIPYGTTKTYGEIAECVAQKMGKPRMSAQAVGTAIGHNPIVIIIPCHRVIAAGGRLGGFSAGCDKKIWLLNHEDCKSVTNFS